MSPRSSAAHAPQPPRPAQRLPAEAPRDRPERYIYPGQWLATAEPMVASTILGTCVAVCVFDVEAGVGGLNHFMLPLAPQSAPDPMRFGDVATLRLVEQAFALGAKKGRLLAKLFGGMSSPLTSAGLIKDLGQRNAAVARRTLEALGVPVVAEDVGGKQSRKLVFHTGDGRAWVRHF